MAATGDDTSPTEPRATADVPGRRLIDLIDAGDADLAASISELVALLDRPTGVRQGWQSAITEE
ncbi:hypothetical protein ACWT_3394 [Actinoplanes sp. SE50]|uniref:hypothetical protein n=1 Tax=unclassified Actinoplanes TaxID=2626549 RepID=UPI00023ED23B|nr:MULTISPECIES: hypothetical protein [unclassified Actinoplanes]AEV84417.1 hypothetical protein ACPL_3522 [Actinoplanes sp. SE50/110]ATO82809.1 hypothetical protein ACWT_3394 [Actinoplanes sp. SE50]SLM00217.1 hypothetical protein ACSP50_3449 [Actinoplanes sp. SE50/110]